jgi:hypothetical protein
MEVACWMQTMVRRREKLSVLHPKMGPHYTQTAINSNGYSNLAAYITTVLFLATFFFIYNLNQQSEFTFYKLMSWLLQCLDGESSSGEYPVPQIRSIGQFLLSHLFSSLNSSVLRSGFSWVSSLVWCLLYFWWMTSCTYDMPRSACSVALETYCTMVHLLSFWGS